MPLKGFFFFSKSLFEYMCFEFRDFLVYGCSQCQGSGVRVGVSAHRKSDTTNEQMEAFYRTKVLSVAFSGPVREPERRQHHRRHHHHLELHFSISCPITALFWVSNLAISTVQDLTLLFYPPGLHLSCERRPLKTSEIRLCYAPS